jgi:diguanylate cyclase (GGDEF)-like protein/PAS domain S-box-containing protein
MPAAPGFTPFAARGRRSVTAILLTFALSSTIGVSLSIGATARSRHRAAVLEVAARQRTLAERYVSEVVLARAGFAVDPAPIAAILSESAAALLSGGTAPAVPGDDDETALPPATDPLVRSQLRQERRLVADMTATGTALLSNRPVTAVALLAGERISTTDPVERVRILAGLTSNVSLNAARTIALSTDRHLSELIVLQIVLGAGGLLVSLLLAWALIAATRRQTAHFSSLVTSSTDLVTVFGPEGCRYVSRSVLDMVGVPESDLLGTGFEERVHRDDRSSVHAATTNGEPRELLLRVTNRFGELRHLEAVLTDLRDDRHVRGVVLNARDVTERTRLEEELTRQAFHDSLTGLANRALFRDRLDHALARSERSVESVCVLLADLDGFKQVNDGLGHGAGDELLQHVARRFLEAVRPSDTVARLGGDEFCILMENADEARAVTVARRMMEVLADPVRVAGRELPVAASIGIVVHPGGPATSEDLIRHADVAMYAAKEAGRGRYEIFRYEMTKALGQQLGLEHEMRQGLARGEFAVHYQPEIDLSSGTVVGVEALLRWTSPTRGPVSPGQFIEAAEASGVIMQLGEFVLQEACRQTAEWRRAGVVPDPFLVWVNLSGKQLSAGGVADLVRGVLADTGLPARCLGLEVTETSIVAGGAAGERAQTELREVHQDGVRIAIDDFGTGFSSLGQLRRFPIDVLKVDRSFVQGIEHDPKDAAITANLASLAHALGLVAVAEGIESVGQLEAARELGCDLAQGFLFARPAAPEDAIRDIAKLMSRPGSPNALAGSAAGPAEAARARL